MVTVRMINVILSKKRSHKNMQTTYKSSSLTSVIKYFIAPIITIIFIYELYLIGGGGDLGDFSLAELPMMAWAVVMTIFSAFYFKDVEITTQNIIVGRGVNKEILDYKNIVWVIQSYLGRPAIYLKYLNPETGSSRIISFIPQIYTEEQFSKIMFHPYRELEVVDFIRTQIRITNGEYNVNAEPSHWNFIWIILLSLFPFLLIFAFLI